MDLDGTPHKLGHNSSHYRNTFIGYCMPFLDCRNLMLQNLLQSWSQKPSVNDDTRPEESTDSEPVMNVNTFHEDGKHIH